MAEVASSLPQDTSQTATDIYARAEALHPTLRARAADADADAEAARMVPAGSVAVFREAGLIRMTQPERLGGQAMGWDALCGVSQRLTRADSAQGWVQAITPRCSA